jgi:large subunit ribosomal protein L15
MSGLHKHKYKWMLKYDPDHFGVHGFVRHHDAQERPPALNLLELQERLAEFEAKGWASRKDQKVEIDLGKAGYGKLLGRGNVKVPLRILVAQASPSALEKVKGSGGEVVTEPQGEG